MGDVYDIGDKSITEAYDVGWGTGCIRGQVVAACSRCQVIARKMSRFLPFAEVKRVFDNDFIVNRGRVEIFYRHGTWIGDGNGIDGLNVRPRSDEGRGNGVYEDIGACKAPCCHIHLGSPCAIGKNPASRFIAFETFGILA